MEDSYTDSDVSMSPTQILERLQVLRQLQLMQRGKLKNQRLQYQESPVSSNVTEIVSHFSNSTSYNTFRSLLHSSEVTYEETPRRNSGDMAPKVKENDMIEGVTVLNLSQESEFIVKSPASTKSSDSHLKVDNVKLTPNLPFSNNSVKIHSVQSKQISLDEMPILSPKKDFEGLLMEKLQNSKEVPDSKSPKSKIVPGIIKKPFLKRGEGTARFGLNKNDLKIQNTRSLPWRRKSFETKCYQSPIKQIKQNNKRNEIKKVADKPQSLCPKPKILVKQSNSLKPENVAHEMKKDSIKSLVESNISEIHTNKTDSNKIIEIPKEKHPFVANKGKTWASVLTNEQNDFLRQLKQSEFYKNFASPTKSSVSDISCNESLINIRQRREAAEQNMFELLENKVSHDSFTLENSFLNKFLKPKNLDSSGESTPLVVQKFIMNNPALRHISAGLSLPEVSSTYTEIDVDRCRSYDCTECCTDNCSSVSTCCSCKATEHTDDNTSCKTTPVQIKQNLKSKEKKVDKEKADSCHNNDTEHDIMKNNLVEMNAKLVNTSELLKERLQELEGEIEIFRKENSNLAKLREDIDLERQKFYQEKAAFEQKFNEEKILSEYYLAEEKEKLTKQKQMYERNIREIRGRLSKKEKDEVINLKKEIESLKEEIRVKDAKSTSTIARLRNQIKIIEKEKKDKETTIEKLKKENKRIQHSNDITRRLSNMKYLAEINKKLKNVNPKDIRSEPDLDDDAKYKDFEIERQSRNKTAPIAKSNTRQRAKSVPNLNVSSAYAKYFSQRDALSQIEQNRTLNKDKINISYSDNDNDLEELEDEQVSDIQDNPNEKSNSEGVNNLEKIYLQTFRCNSPKSFRSSTSSVDSNSNIQEKRDNNFITKSNSFSNSIRTSKSPNSTTRTYQNYSTNRSKSPVSILSNRSQTSGYSPESCSDFFGINENLRTKSPISTMLSNHSSLRSETVIFNEKSADATKQTSSSSLTKTNLNPMEIKRSDGSRELRFPNGNVKHISADGKYSKFIYYNGDVKENFYSDGIIKYYYAETKTYHTTHPDGLEVLEFPDGQVEKRYKDGSSEIRLPNGSIRYFDPKNEHVREEWRFPDGAALTISASGEQRIIFSNGQIEVHAADHKRREFPDGTVKLVYHDGTSETRYASGRIRIKDKHGSLIMDSARN